MFSITYSSIVIIEVKRGSIPFLGKRGEESFFIFHVDLDGIGNSIITSLGAHFLHGGGIFFAAKGEYFMLPLDWEQVLIKEWARNVGVKDKLFSPFKNNSGYKWILTCHS